MNPRFRKYFFILSTLLSTGLIAVGYTNCSNKKFKVNQSSAFQNAFSKDELLEGMNYAGPHLSFELIPAMEPFETDPLDEFARRLTESADSCERGGTNGEELSLYAKVQMQTQGLDYGRYCTQLSDANLVIVNGIFESSAFKDAGYDKNKIFQLQEFEAFSGVSAIAVAERLTAFSCFSAIWATLKEPPSNGIRLKAAFAQVTDGRIEIRGDRVDNGATVFRILPSPTPMVLPWFEQKSVYATSVLDPLQSLERLGRIEPILGAGLGQFTPLMELISNKVSPLNFNQHEYMSCLQGQLYRVDLSLIGDSYERGAGKQARRRALKSQEDQFCEIISPWTESLSGRKSMDGWFTTSDNMGIVSSSWDNEYATRVTVARNLFAAYQKGEVDLRSIPDCLFVTEEYTGFMNTLRSVFYEETIKKFSQSEDELVKKYLSKLKMFDSKGTWPLYDLRGVSRLTPKEAFEEQIYRYPNLFSDFNLIPPESWWLVFLHESLHRLDTRMIYASAAFAGSSFEVEDLAAAYDSVRDLDESSAQMLDEWIGFGFERGLISEYRAWLITFRLYKALVRDSHIPEIRWVERYLRPRETSAEPFECQLFADLNKKSETKFSYEILNDDLLKDAINKYTQTHHSCAEIKKLSPLID